jgi:hypothetical protein
MINNYSRGALVIAHPSHELRVHGWLQKARPRVFVLTDGSGREAHPRLVSTTKMLQDLDVETGSVYGRVSDRDVYNAFLRRDFSFFIGLAEELAGEFYSHQIEYVVGDSAEGYSPTHDACRLLVDAALEIVARRYQRQIANFDFAVVGLPEESEAALSNEAIWIQLDEEAFARKVAAARAYSGRLALDVDAALLGAPFLGVRRLSEPQLAGEVDQELNAEIVRTLLANTRLAGKFKHVFEGIELARFRTECLRPVRLPSAHQYGSDEGLFYEMYGENMVAAGHYRITIRYAQHFRPLAEAVWRHVESAQDHSSLVQPSRRGESASG